MPERFGKYEVEEKIGEGGFGVVYLGRDPVLKRSVAIKTCTFTDDELRRRFLREAEISAGLQHPNIVTVYDFGKEGDQPYLVQEFLEGRDVDEILSAGEPVSLTTRIEWLRQVAEGLRYAHGEGVVHRDVKPANVRVQPDGRVRILDFGIAKLVDSPEQLTRTGMSVGTAAYLSPEQLQGYDVDARADVFSFGSLTYEVLTGARAFDGDSLSAIIYGVAHREPAPLAELAPEVPPSLASLVAGCLVKDRERRIQDFDGVLTLLRHAARETREGGEAGQETAQAAAAGSSPPPAHAASSTAGPEDGSGRGAGAEAGAAAPSGGSDREVRGSRRTWLGLGAAAVVVALLAVLSVARWGATTPGDAGADGDEARMGVAVAPDDRGEPEAASPTADTTFAPPEVGRTGEDEASNPGPADAGTAPAGGAPSEEAGTGDSGTAVDPVPEGGAPETEEPAAEPAPAQVAPEPREPPSEEDDAAPAPPGPPTAELDPSRILLVVYGEAGTGAQEAETAALRTLPREGFEAVDRASLEIGGAPPAGWDPGGLGGAARRGGAGHLVVGVFESDARPAPGGFVTGLARLDLRVYDTGTGELLGTETIRVGGGGVPGELGPTAGEARSAAGTAVGERAARWLAGRLAGR
jgi:serine/threonine-protein kinase